MGPVFILVRYTTEDAQVLCDEEDEQTGESSVQDFKPFHDRFLCRSVPFWPQTTRSQTVLWSVTQAKWTTQQYDQQMQVSIISIMFTTLTVQ